MIGLGVGIDYALFILSRHRDNLDAGMDNDESIGRTNATAGQAVVVAGGTVVVAILGLQLAGIPFVAALGYSASLVVAIAVLVAITLLPALLGFAGPRVLAKSHRRAAERAAEAAASGDALEVERRSQRLGALGALGGPPPVAIQRSRPPSCCWCLAIPVLDMRLGQADAGTDPTSHHPPPGLRPARRRVR